MTPARLLTKWRVWDERPRSYIARKAIQQYLQQRKAEVQNVQ